MKLSLLSPAKALSKAYLKQSLKREQIEHFNSKLIKAYREWSDGLFGLKNTDWFYQEIARPFIEKELEELPSVHFDLHLLKHPFANDTNRLNREFYSELLHVIVLEEVKDKGEKLISRKDDSRRDEGSLLENTINILRVRNCLALFPYPEQLGATDDERYFSLALELCITWLNRILFLKLLEGQLCAYHRGNRDYAFLSTRCIADFDELEELFFEVLARRHDERIPSVRNKFGAIPYLNSSLFEESDMERATIHLTDLKVDFRSIYKLLGKPVPQSNDEELQWMKDEKMIEVVDGAGYYITNFGALAAAFRRYNICEERGSGFEKAVAAIELFGLPPLKFEELENSFRVTMSSPKSFAELAPMERVEATYQHTIIKYYSSGGMTNTSLRERFKMHEKQRPQVSLVIKEALAQCKIKPEDPNNISTKFAKYIPAWG